MGSWPTSAINESSQHSKRCSLVTEIDSNRAIEPGDTPRDVLDEAMVFAGTNDRAGAVDYRLDIGIDAGRSADRRGLEEDH